MNGALAYGERVGPVADISWSIVAEAQNRGALVLAAVVLTLRSKRSHLFIQVRLESGNVKP